MKVSLLIALGILPTMTLILLASQAQERKNKHPVVQATPLMGVTASLGPQTLEQEQRARAILEASRNLVPRAKQALKRGDYGEAENLFREALPMTQGSPVYLETAVGLASIFEHQGKQAEALSAYHQAFGSTQSQGFYSNFPHDVEALTRYGLLSAQAGQWREAVRVYEQARDRLNPKPDVVLDVNFDSVVPQPEQLCAMLHVVRGLTLEEQGKGNEALAAYSKAASLQPDQPLAQFYLGRGLQKAGRAAEAQAAFQKAARFGHGAVQAEARKALR